MHFIAHRVNTIKDLLNTPVEYGVEVDLRDFGKKLILQHDPFKDGESFEEYLKNYNHGTMILNIKSEGIETKVLKLLRQYNVKSYFFLDCSFPMINFLMLKIPLRKDNLFEYKRPHTIQMGLGAANLLQI